MAIEDTDPERRNLIVAAIAFIAYHYGGGHFPDRTVTLEVINMEFSNPVFLAAMAWTALFWFMYRYWLTHAGKFRRHFATEFDTFQAKAYVQRYVASRIQEQPAVEKGAGPHVNRLLWFGRRVLASYIYASNVKRDPETGRIKSYSDVKINGGQVSFNDLKGWIVALRATGACFFQHPSFSSYIVPYLLFVFALIGPAYRYWPQLLETVK
jgi:hypothetical protein